MSYFSQTEESVFTQFKLPQEIQRQEQQKVYQFGKTKIFFRSGQVALLERIRAQKLRECAILLQRMIRGWIVRRRYIKIRYTILRLQCYSRRYLARKLYVHLKQTKAAIAIQTKWRSWSARNKYLKIRKAAVGLQRFGRGLIARRKFMQIKRNLAAITIQRYVKGYLARKHYQQKRRKIIIAQSSVRRWLAKRELKKLKIEARSVEHVTKLNRGLERKIIELQQRINDMNGELKAQKQIGTEMTESKKSVEKLDIELKNLRNILMQRDSEIETIREELNTIKNHNENLTTEIENYKTHINSLESNNAKIKEENNPKLIEDIINEKEKTLIAKYEKEKKALIDERENERASRQQLLRKYMALEEQLQSGGRGDGEESSSPGFTCYYL